MKKLFLSLSIISVTAIFLIIIGFMLGGTKMFFNANNAQAITNNLEKIKAIELNIASGEVNIEKSTGYAIEIKNGGRKIEYQMQGSKLIVKQEVFIWNLFDFSKSSATIFLPEDAFIENANLKITSGKLNISKLNGNTINLKLTSGEISANKLTAKSTAIKCTSGKIQVDGCITQGLNMNLTSGKISATNIKTNGLVARITSGNADLSGEFLGNNDIRVTSGKVDMDITGSSQEYNKYLSVTSGKILVNGGEMTGKITQTNAKNTMKIDLTSGLANIKFTKD